MNKFINKLLHEAMPYFPQQRFSDEWGGEHKPEMKDHGGIQCWFNQSEEL